MVEINNFYEEKILNKIQSNFGIEVFTPGLDRTRNLYLPYIESLKKKGTKIITVAGTNGKGQTCHTIAYYLKAADKNFALWTSPHILSIRERFNINSNEISYSELEALIDKNLLKVKECNFKISFYEFLFLLFLDWADQTNLDFVILEVGLGGKLDAVNHFDTDLALITSISRDHQAILGNSYEKILYEKLGISRKNVQLITSFSLNYLIELTTKYSQNNQIPYKNILNKENYFLSNIAIAQEAIKYFGIEIEDPDLLPKFKGREEVIQIKNIEFTFIGAHNPEGIRVTLDRISKERLAFQFDHLLLSFSKRSNEDLIGMIKSILEKRDLFQEINLTHFEHPKAISYDILRDVLIPICNNKLLLEKDWKKLLNGFYQRPQKIKILVAGSYYFIGEVQSFILSN